MSSYNRFIITLLDIILFSNFNTEQIENFYYIVGLELLGVRPAICRYVFLKENYKRFSSIRFEMDWINLNYMLEGLFLPIRKSNPSVLLKVYFYQLFEFLYIFFVIQTSRRKWVLVPKCVFFFLIHVIPRKFQLKFKVIVNAYTLILKIESISWYWHTFYYT